MQRHAGVNERVGVFLYVYTGMQLRGTVLNSCAAVGTPPEGEHRKTTLDLSIL